MRKIEAAEMRMLLESKIPADKKSFLDAVMQQGFIGGDFSTVLNAFNEAQITLEPSDTFRPNTNCFGLLEMPRRSLLVSVDNEGVVSLKDAA